VRSQGWWTNDDQYAQAAQVRHEFYNPTLSPPWQEGVCPADNFGRQDIQRVTVTVTSPDRSVSRTIQVIKAQREDQPREIEIEP